MAGLLGFYFVFVLIYLFYSAYAILRMWQMRIRGDATTLSIGIYIVVVGIILIVTFVLLGLTQWQNALSEIRGR